MHLPLVEGSLVRLSERRGALVTLDAVAAAIVDALVNTEACLESKDLGLNVSVTS